MPVQQLTSTDDPRLAWYRGVADPALLRAGGRFIAEGRAVVARLLANPRWDVESVLVSPAALDALGPVVATRDDVTVFVMDPARLVALAGYNIHRGCLAVGRRPPMPDLGDVVPAARARLLVLGLEALANADNVGACFRNAAAFGADTVLLDDTSADPLYRKAIRTSMGAALQVPFTRVGAWPAAVNRLRATGVTCVGLTPATGAPPVTHLEPAVLAAPRLLLLVGNEGAGLAPSTLQACDRLARIGMAPGADSLNVATAAAVALHVVRASREGVTGGTASPAVVPRADVGQDGSSR